MSHSSDLTDWKSKFVSTINNPIYDSASDFHVQEYYRALMFKSGLKPMQLASLLVNYWDYKPGREAPLLPKVSDTSSVPIDTIRLYAYGLRTGRSYWYGKFYSDPIDAVAHTNISRSSFVKEGSSYLISVSLPKDTPIGPAISEAETKSDWSGYPPRPKNKLSLIPDPKFPQLQVYWLYDDSFPYISQPDTILTVKVSKHTADSDYNVYREFIRSNLNGWILSCPMEMPRLSDPNELLSYGQLLDSLFRESETPSLESIFSREFGFKIGAPPKLQEERRITGGQMSITTTGMMDGKQVLYKRVSNVDALREALIIRYLNIVLPGHAPVLIDVYFGKGDGFVVMEFITDASSSAVRDNLPTALYIAYSRKMLQLAVNELLAGIWCKDINEGNWLFKRPYSEVNPIVYRIDYGQETCFLTSQLPDSYNCHELRTKLYNRLDEIYNMFIEDASSRLRLATIENEQTLLKSFIDEMEHQSSLFMPLRI